jgi:uncharacterized protein
MRLLAVLVFIALSPASAADAPAVLWSVRGAHNTVYLAGSMHFLPESAPLPPALLAAYEDAEQLVMELDMDDIAPAEVQMVTLQQGMLPPDRTLEQELGTSVFARVQKEADELGFDAELLQRMRPWLVGLTLTQLQLAKLGWSSHAGVEQRFVRMAAEDRKTIKGLETLSTQIGLLAAMPADLQRQFVLYSVDDTVAMAEEVEKLGAAWRKGDVAELELLLNESFRKYPALYETLTVKRNRAWMHSIEPLLKERDDYLVIVGAAHLLGRDSVVELLRQRGLAVKRH